MLGTPSLKIGLVGCVGWLSPVLDPWGWLVGASLEGPVCLGWGTACGQPLTLGPFWLGG